MGDLSTGSEVLQRVDAEAQDVVIVAEVEALAVQLPVVDHTHRRHVVQHLAALSVEQVVPAVVTTVPAHRHPQRVSFIVRIVVRSLPFVWVKGAAPSHLGDTVHVRVAPVKSYP